MSEHFCILNSKLQERIKEVGDGSLRDGAIRLLNHWEAQPTEEEMQAKRDEEIAQQQAELQSRILDN